MEKKKADVFKCCPMLSVSLNNRIKDEGSILFLNGGQRGAERKTCCCCNFVYFSDAFRLCLRHIGEEVTNGSVHMKFPNCSECRYVIVYLNSSAISKHEAVFGDCRSEQQIFAALTSSRRFC